MHPACANMAIELTQLILVS